MEEILKEMLGKRPDELEGETLKLFNAIMKIADERDELKTRNKELEQENIKLQEKNEELEEKNQYYEDLINALETYYNITIENLENSVKEDK